MVRIKSEVKQSKVKFTLYRVTKAQKWSSGIATLILNLIARRGWLVRAT